MHRRRFGPAYVLHTVPVCLPVFQRGLSLTRHAVSARHRSHPFLAVISWLNKQLNDGAGPVRRFTVEKYMTTGVAGIAADVVKPTRAPFGTKTASELNKRQVHYKGKAASGAMSAGSSSRNPSPAVFEQYLPKQISPVDLDSQKEDVRYVARRYHTPRPS